MIDEISLFLCPNPMCGLSKHARMWCGGSGSKSGTSGTTIGTSPSTIRILDVVTPSEENREELEASLDKFLWCGGREKATEWDSTAGRVICPGSDEKREEQSARVGAASVMRSRNCAQCLSGLRL